MAQSANQPPKDVMGFLNYYLVTKAPFQLPAGVKEWIVKYGPWIDVVLLVLFLPIILLAIGVTAALSPLAIVGGGTRAAAGLGVATIILIVQLVLMVAALPGLFRRQKAGWTLVFYGEVVNIVYSLLSGNILGGLIGGLIGLYFIFQIRSYYK